MRLPGWLFVIAALFLVAATVICAAGSYGFARQIAVDLANSGVPGGCMNRPTTYWATT